MLKSEDYINILEFSSRINKSYENFSENVRLELSQLFGLQLTAFSVYNIDKNDEPYVVSVQSAFLSDELLYSYKKSLFKHDLFQRRLSRKKSLNTFKYVYFVEDVSTREEFFGTGYGLSLAEYSIIQQAVLKPPLSHPFPHEVISIFRTESQGDFTPYEMQLLDCIGKVFVESTQHHSRNLRSQSFLHMIDWYGDSTETGLAILDSNNRLFYHNSFFVKSAANFSKKRNVTDMIAELIDLACENAGISSDKLASLVTLSKGEFCLEVRKSSYFRDDILEKNTFVTITANKQTRPAPSNNMIISEQYNFTQREIEVLEYMVRGYSNIQIAESLFINISTAKFHIRNIFLKLGVTTRSAAIYKILTYNTSLNFLNG